jgi:hypothetical protein
LSHLATLSRKLYQIAKKINKEGSIRTETVLYRRKRSYSIVMIYPYEGGYMSDTTNPYQSPETSVNPVKPLVAQGTLTETMLMYLQQASPWLRFIGILGFIQCGFMALGALSFFALMPFGEVWNQLSQMPGFEAAVSGFGGVFGGVLGIYMLGAAVFVFFPSYFIYNFGAKIRTYLQTGADQDLEGALKNNKSLWKFSGILAIIGLAFVPVIFIVMIVVAVVSF